MKPPNTQSSQLVYEGYFNMRKDKLMREDGETLDFTCLEIPWDAAVIIAEDKEGRLIINREYRHPTGQFILGFPGGRLEEEEDPITGGKRELFEETGYRSEELTLIGCCYPIPSICNQKIYFIHAKNAVPSKERKLDPFEFIETDLKTEEELRKEILSGALVDGILCTALWYKSHATC
jgi:ADP-ribose pyrophosphatase